MRLALAVCAVGMSIANSAAASAQMTERDLAIVGRALNFIEGAQPGQSVVALVFDEAGQAEAEALHAIMSNGYEARSITMVSRLVPVSEVANGLAGANSALLLGGLSAGDSEIANAVSNNGVMSVSSNMACVQSGNCVMSVQSDPSVRIVVNQGAADGASVVFTSAFAMMIERI